ncbi:MAG TPA: ABC transporter permease, partial [Vicinamibacterales bacterium]|nr:ABC transporter permease [Vicinamibacterales bacterium]
MGFVGIATLKDLRRRIADPAALLMWLGLPVVIGTLMALIGGSGGGPPKARVLLVDLDQTFVSRLVGMAGGSSQLAEFLEIETVTEEEGRRRIDAGDANALLILPKGFQDGVLREQPTELSLVKNPSQRILPGIVEEGLRMVVEAAFYAQRLFGEPIRQIADGVSGSTGPSDAAVAAVSQSINQRLQKLQSTLSPPALSLDTGAATAAAESFNFGAMFMPGLLFMAVMFTAQGISNDIWVEKTNGTLRRTLSAPQGAGAFLAGKIGAGVAVMAGATLLAIALGIAGFGVPWSRAPLALLWASYSGAAILCMMTGLQLISTSARGGQLLSTMVVFPLIMIGGSFFPFETMPAWMAGVGRWTPNGLAVLETKKIL